MFFKNLLKKTWIFISNRKNLNCAKLGDLKSSQLKKIKIFKKLLP